MRWITGGAIAVLLLAMTVLRFWGEYLAPSILNPGFRSDATPASVGVPFERLAIPSGTRRLDAFFVAAAAGCPKRAAVLIFHGRGETVADWIRAQKFLRNRCITSLVFDYTGHGRSSPHGTIYRVNRDAAAAYAAFVDKTPNMRRCLFGFSMGAGPMLQAALGFVPRPDCAVVANAFTSLRDLATANGVPRWLSRTMPDGWNNTEQIARLHVPLMIVHSRADHADPFWMGETLFSAANTPKRLVTLAGFKHNACHRNPTDTWWSPAAGFILG